MQLRKWRQWQGWARAGRKLGLQNTSLTSALVGENTRNQSEDWSWSSSVQFSYFTSDKTKDEGLTSPRSHSSSGSEARPLCLLINPCLPTCNYSFWGLFIFSIFTALMGLWFNSFHKKPEICKKNLILLVAKVRLTTQISRTLNGFSLSPDPGWDTFTYIASRTIEKKPRVKQ